MKTIFTFCLAVILISCGNHSSKKTDEQQQSFDWMLGSWIRTNDSNGNKTFENWKKISSEEYSGFGYTLNNGDTIFQENLRIFSKGQYWNLQVTGEVGAPVLFAISDFSSKKFTAVNEANEFPKKIIYERRGDQLQATIADEETKIPFIFSKATTE